MAIKRFAFPKFGEFDADCYRNITNRAARSTLLNLYRHAVDLHQSKAWSDYQRFCFDGELKQPFKQIFREPYLPTDDELRGKSVSRRYAGHQVQPRQTAALLKTRGWKMSNK